MKKDNLINNKILFFYVIYIKLNLFYILVLESWINGVNLSLGKKGDWSIKINSSLNIQKIVDFNNKIRFTCNVKRVKLKKL